jgi:LmbE family N-acetylglucosaminyl deacetylase
VRLGLPDGGLQDMRCELAERLLSLLQPGDVVFTTWRMDGHPDHEATGHACAFAAARVGARLVEVPVWAWHWATPGDPRMPWRRAVRLPFGADIVARKRMALLAHQSQLLPDSTTGAGPVLRGDMVARAERPFEIMWT